MPQNNSNHEYQLDSLQLVIDHYQDSLQVVSQPIESGSPDSNVSIYLLILGLVTIFGLLLTILIPKIQVSKLRLKKHEKIELASKLRTSIAQIVGGVFVLSSLLFTVIEFSENRKTTQESLRLSRDILEESKKEIAEKIRYDTISLQLNRDQIKLSAAQSQQNFDLLTEQNKVSKSSTFGKIFAESVDKLFQSTEDDIATKYAAINSLKILALADSSYYRSVLLTLENYINNTSKLTRYYEIDSLEEIFYAFYFFSTDLAIRKKPRRMFMLHPTQKKQSQVQIEFNSKEFLTGYGSSSMYFNSFLLGSDSTAYMTYFEKGVSREIREESDIEAVKESWFLPLIRIAMNERENSKYLLGTPYKKDIEESIMAIGSIIQHYSAREQLTDFYNVRLEFKLVNFSECNFQGTYSNLVFNKCNFAFSKLSNSSFINSKFENCTFTSQTLYGSSEMDTYFHNPLLLATPATFTDRNFNREDYIPVLHEKDDLNRLLGLDSTAYLRYTFPNFRLRYY